MSEATKIMQTRIDYLSGCIEDLKEAIKYRDGQLNRLRRILVRVNALNDNPAHFCKEIDDMTLEFAHRNRLTEANPEAAK
jgi:prefoldin subunit 5